jgi:hypothetical protein
MLSPIFTAERSMLAMTPPALVPFAAATAVLVTGTGAVSAAPAAGALLPPRSAMHLPASHAPAAMPTALPAEPGAPAARGSGAVPAGLAASSVAAATSGAGHPVRDSGRAAGRPRAGSARIRAPPQ